MQWFSLDTIEHAMVILYLNNNYTEAKILENLEIRKCINAKIEAF